jgi:hypothetical protein
MGIRMSAIAGSMARPRSVGVSWIKSGGLPAPRISVVRYGPRSSINNPVATRFYNTVNRQYMNRSITKGPWVPSFGRLGIGAGRVAQMAGERNSVVAFQNAVNQARNAPPIVKYRDPRTGAVTDFPVSRVNLGKFGSQGWRFKQNNAGQSKNTGYSSGMSQFSINAPSGVGLNRMR